MAKRNSGQATVEYVILLVIFASVAVEGWNLLYPAISGLYDHFKARRAGVMGMRP